MKKLVAAIIILALCAFTLNGCVDIDEALPHYGQQDQKAVW